MRDFHKLEVWRLGHELTLRIYRASSTFPTSESFGLTSQLRRAASSIPTNIAEGCGRNGEADFARFLDIAMGSAKETEYLLLLTLDLNYITDSQHESLRDDLISVQRMLATLIRRLRPPTPR